MTRETLAIAPAMPAAVEGPRSQALRGTPMASVR